MAQVKATYTVDVDADEDQIYDGGTETITSDVMQTPGIVITRGRDQIRDVAPPKAGTGRFDLDNSGSTYDVSDTLINDGDVVRIRATDPTTSIVHDLWTGIVSKLSQDPDPRQKRVHVRLQGNLSKLAGGRSGLSTLLYEDITTGVALGHLLDAAEWPKTLPDYAQNDLDNLAGYWGLGEASGNFADSSGNSNTAAATAIAAYGATALDNNGDGSAEFNGSTSKAEVTDAATIRNVFDGGGSIFFMFDVDSDGEGDAGRVCQKVWDLRTMSESSSLVRLQFSVPWSGTNGVWQTAVNIPINTTIIGVLTYDADAVGNNPTIYLWNGSSYAALTVGSGLTESTGPPSGARTTDVGSALVMGNNTGQTATLDGHLDEVALFSDTLTEAEAKALIARALAAPRKLDTGKQTLESWWLDDRERVFTAMNSILSTEGPGAVIYEDGSGAIVFKDRHARVTESRSTAVQKTYVGATSEPVTHRARHDSGRGGVINVATMTRKGRTAATSAAIWTLGATIALAANETKKITVRQADRKPFKTAINPTASPDYTVDSGSVTSITLDRVSGSSAELTIVAGASGVTLSGLQVRAQSWNVDGTGDGTDIKNTVDAATSIAKYGERGLPERIKIREEIALVSAQDLTNAYVGFHDEERPTSRFKVYGNRNATAMTAALPMEISDRVRLNLTAGNIDINAHIEQIEHRVTRGPLHETILGVEKATASQPWIWDTSTWDGEDVWWY